jgi:hypothetical protein
MKMSVKPGRRGQLQCRAVPPSFALETVSRGTSESGELWLWPREVEAKRVVVVVVVSNP